MKLTRRNLATVLASAAVASAQQASPPPAPPADELIQAARARMLANAAALHQPAIPMATEPAFQFKV